MRVGGYNTSWSREEWAEGMKDEPKVNDAADGRA